MKKIYNEENIENVLKSLKIKETAGCDDFTNKVMDRIKNSSDFDDSYDLTMVDDMLECLPYQDTVEPKADFTSSVMARIKSEKKVYNEENIENLLAELKTTPIRLPKKDFTENVMQKIKEESDDSIISFEKVYKKFLIGSAIVAAAAILLALNLFSTYDPSMAEFMVTDYFNTGLY